MDNAGRERQAGREPKAGARVFFLDALRAAAAFLVIVNHTNSAVFQAAGPGEASWWLSLAWYYLSKTAVPLFVMVSGAMLLGRQDGYGKTAWRVARMALTLVLFSYFYFLWDLWLTHWTWAGAFDFAAFFARIWQGPITDSFWYLYFYIGLLLMLPLLQRLAAGMRPKDYLYLVGFSMLLGAACPLLAHYLPALALPPYFDAPLFSIFLGLFFAGRYLYAYAKPSRGKGWACLAALLAGIVVSLALTWVEYTRMGGHGPYWFMDERTSPALPTVICALAAFFLPRCWGKGAPAHPGRLSLPAKAVTILGGCAFGIYLLQDWVTAETKTRMYHPLLAALPPLPAVLLWELLIFAICAAAAWVLKKLPGLKKLL